MHLARLYEQRAGLLTQQQRRAAPQIQHTPFVKRLNRAEMEARRAKGLCFNCDEAFIPGHRCKKLFWLEGIEDMMEDEVGEDVDDEQEGVVGASLNVIKWSDNAKTLQIWGRILHSSALVLIDSGSTHCFIDTSLAKSLHLPIQGQQLRVAVANGGQLQCSGLSSNVQVQLGENLLSWISFSSL